MIKEIVYTCQSQFQVIVRVSYVSTCQLHCENILLVGLFPATMQTGFIDRGYFSFLNHPIHMAIRVKTRQNKILIQIYGGSYPSKVIVFIRRRMFPYAATPKRK